jgi:DNA-binding NtrC family response regulator
VTLPKYTQTLTLAALERVVVTQRLRKFKGHRRRTARSLGMGLRTLTMKLGRWGLAGDANGRQREGRAA